MCHWLTVRTSIASTGWSTDSPMAYGFGAVHKLYLVLSRERVCTDWKELKSSNYRDFGIRLLLLGAIDTWEQDKFRGPLTKWAYLLAHKDSASSCNRREEKTKNQNVDLTDKGTRASHRFIS